jgi:hypothetical protein
MSGMRGLNIDMGPQQVMGLMNDPKGVERMLKQASDDTGDSPADIMADIINIQRLDTKMIAKQQGVDLEINEMTPERAAELLAGVIQGEGVALLMVFNELEDYNHQILREAMGEHEFENYRRAKVGSLNSTTDE